MGKGPFHHVEAPARLMVGFWVKAEVSGEFQSEKQREDGIVLFHQVEPLQGADDEVVQGFVLFLLRDGLRQQLADVHHDGALVHHHGQAVVHHGQLCVFEVAEGVAFRVAHLDILDDVEVLEQGGTVLGASVEGAFQHIGLQALRPGEHLHDEAGVAVAHRLQDDAFGFVVHQFWMRILVANLFLPSLVLTKMRYTPGVTFSPLMVVQSHTA